METIESIIKAVGTVCSKVSPALPLLIVISPFLILSLILIPIFMIRGFRKGLYLSLVSLGATVLAYITSVLLTKPVARLISYLIFGKIKDEAANGNEEILKAFETSEYASEFSIALITMVTAALIFFLVFLAVVITAKIVSGMLLRKALSKEDQGAGFRVGGMMIRLVDAVLLAFLFFVPFYAVINTGALTAEKMLVRLEEMDDHGRIKAEDAQFRNDLEKSKEAVETLSKAPPIVLSSGQSIGFAYRYFGGFTVSDMDYVAGDLLIKSGDVAAQSAELFVNKPEDYGSDEKRAIDRMTGNIAEEPFFGGLVSDAIRIFEGFTDKIESKNSRELTATALEKMRGCTPEEANEMIASLGAIVQKLIDCGAFKPTEKEGELADRLTFEAVESIDGNIRSSKLLSKVCDALAVKYTEILKDKMTEDSDGEYRGKISGICDDVRKRINEDPISDPDEVKAETRAFDRMLKGVSRLRSGAEESGSSEYDKLDTDAFSDVIVGLALHPYFGEETADRILEVYLPHSDSKEQPLFTDKVIKTVKDALHDDVQLASAGYEPTKLKSLLRSTKHLTKAIDLMKESAAVLHPLEKVVGDIMDDMTVDTAKAIGENLTAEVMSVLGVQGENGEQIGSFVKDLLENIAENTGSDRENDKRAIAQMSSLVVGAWEREEEKKSGRTFESVVGGDLKAFIEAVANSEAVMSTVRSALERAGTSDPTDSFGYLTKQDKLAILRACMDLSVSVNAEDLKLLCEFMGVDGTGLVLE